MKSISIYLFSLFMLFAPFSMAIAQEEEGQEKKTSDYEYLKQLFSKKSDSTDVASDSSQTQLERFTEQMISFKKRNNINTDSTQAETTTISDSTNTTTDLIYRPAQFTFLYPVGSNGKHPEKYKNGFSLNAIAGYNGGLQGLEIGGVANITKEVDGVQIAGVTNLSDSLQGLQFSTVNLTKKAIGGQFGAVNMSKSLKGAQVGVINLTEDATGAQIGLINKSKNTTGAMIGLINVADSLTGAPIGLINVVRKNGFRAVEFTYSDVFQITGNYKIGTDPFYTIIGLGYQKVSSDYERWGIGLGFGSQWNIAHDGWVKMGVEAMTYQVGENEFWTNHWNLLNQLKINFAVQLAKNASLVFGPSLNIQLSESGVVPDDAPGFSESNVFYSDTFQRRRHNETYIDPWTGELNHNLGKEFDMNIWAGFHVGIRFHNKSN